MRDAEVPYEISGRKKQVEDLTCGWARKLEQMATDDTLSIVVWRAFLSNIERELWNMQEFLKLPKYVHQKTLEELRTESNCLGGNIKVLMIGMIEHRLILASMTEAIEKAPAYIHEAVSEEWATSMMRREHLSKWYEDFTPRMNKAIGLLSEALMNSEA